jgi:hypothetical protein
MFYYDNGKVCVFANTRCGNTNMYHHFGFKPYSKAVDDFNAWSTTTTSQRVVVLRNPIDRMVSAINAVPAMPFGTTFPIDVVRNKYYTESYIESCMETTLFKMHCSPYLHKISNEPFKIIDFSRLNEYIPRKMNLLQSPTTNSNNYTDPKSAYIKNKYFSLTELEKEYEIYLSLLKEREQISVEEWKEKTIE